VNWANDDPRVLELPSMQPLLHRLAEASSFVAADFDRFAHVKAIALDVLAARARPRCPQPGTEA